ncbi:unnamed protein product [Symbiodinium necroappetens]|uniref:Uncharacterized protein n=1 Tax=Symbiodinium necroappetens TaxID=1628268 RepID=A0A812R9I5_9DINO|nr:unnamed protein product [Symbiodinium necroappetens]
MARLCSKLDKEVHALFDCAEQVIKIPEGYAITRESTICSNDECAVKCPNPKACPGGLYDRQQCSAGYDVQSVGCSQCDVGFGRSNQDPFVCGQCGDIWQMWIVHLGKPVGIYLLSLRSAKPNRDLQSVLFNMLLSFGTVSASLWPAIKDSEAYHHALPAVQAVVRAGDASMSTTTPWHGPSMDCLLQASQASMPQWLLLTGVAPMILLIASLTIVLAGSVWTGHQLDRQLLPDFIKPCLVLTNCFLPDLLGALVRFVPCIHFQLAATSFESYAVTKECAGVAGRYATCICTLLLGAAIGPGAWISLIHHRTSMWPRETCQHLLGFLTSGYRGEVAWWQAGVLARKCLLVMAASLFPMSYSPMLFLACVLLIMGASLTCHTLTWPYDDAFLNALEFGALVSSTLAVMATMLLSLQPTTWSLDFSITCPVLALLLVLLLVPFAVLMALFLREALRKVQHVNQGGINEDAK